MASGRKSQGMYQRFVVCFAILLLASVAQAGWRTDLRDEKPISSGEKTSGSTTESRALTKQSASLHRASKLAITKYSKQIRKHWAQAEMTSSSSWVAYSDDFTVKRVVDYQANEIRISLDRASNGGRVDFKKVNKKVRKELVKMLKTTVRDAYETDPVSIEIHRSMKDSKDLLAQLPDELILNELFNKPKPSANEMGRRAAQLLKGAVISYAQGLASASYSTPISLGEKLTYQIPLPTDRMMKKARQYKAAVYKYAKEHNVPTDLMFAIIHTESHFNPMARSHIPAYGLMQIVPATAGRDASKLLFDKSQVLSPSYLYEPEQNIEVGAAYLNLLYYRYMAGIDDATSRLLCTIAAYNGGATNVAKAFTSVGRMSKAVGVINSMSPEKVRSVLKSRLPAKETQEYVKKVTRRQKLYQRI